MAEIDLRALSAPLEALRGDVEASYARLDAKWTAIAEQLRALPIPVKVSHTIWSHEDRDEWTALEFKKWNGVKRLCLAEYVFNGDGVEESTTPFEEWSLDQRMSFLGYVPGLFAEAVTATKKFIEQTQI